MQASVIGQSSFLVHLTVFGGGDGGFLGGYLKVRAKERTSIKQNKVACWRKLAIRRDIYIGLWYIWD